MRRPRPWRRDAARLGLAFFEVRQSSAPDRKDSWWFAERGCREPDQDRSLDVDLIQFQLIDITIDYQHHIFMRTTLSLDDDVFELVMRQAKLRGLSLGRTVSDLVRRGLRAPTPSEHEGGLVVFQLPADSPTVTTEEVRRIEIEGM